MQVQIPATALQASRSPTAEIAPESRSCRDRRRISIVLGFEYLENKDTIVTWNGVANTHVQFYDAMFRLGLRGTLPLGPIQPWVGCGVNVGTMTFTNPNDRPLNNVTIGFATRGTVGAWGTYLEGGLDIRLGSSGLRGSYTVANRQTDSSDPLSGDKYNSTLTIIGLGIFAEL